MLSRATGVCCAISLLTAVACGTLFPVAAPAQDYTFLGSWPTIGAPLGFALDRRYDRILLSAPASAPVIQRYSPNGTLDALLGIGGPLDIYGIAAFYDDGDIFYAHYQSSRVWHMSLSGVDKGGWGRSVCCLRYMTLDNEKNLYITDPLDNLVLKYASSPKYGDYFVGQWSVPHPSGIAYLGGVIYVASLDGGTIRKFSKTGSPLGSFDVGAVSAEQLAVGPTGLLNLVDGGSSRILVFSVNGALLETIGNSPPGYPYGPARYVGLTVIGNGTIYAGDNAHGRVLMFGPSPTAARPATWGRIKALYR